MILDFSCVTFTINVNLPNPSRKQRGEKTVEKLCNLVIVKFYLLFTRWTRVFSNLRINCAPFPMPFTIFIQNTSNDKPTFREIIKRFNLSIFIPSPEFYRRRRKFRGAFNLETSFDSRWKIVSNHCSLLIPAQTFVPIFFDSGHNKAILHKPGHSQDNKNLQWTGNNILRVFNLYKLK